MQLSDQPAQLLIDPAGRNAEITILINANHGAARVVARFRIDNCLEFHVLNSVFVHCCLQGLSK